MMIILITEIILLFVALALSKSDNKKAESVGAVLTLCMLFAVLATAIIYGVMFFTAMYNFFVRG